MTEDIKGKLDSQSKDLMGRYSSLVSPLSIKFKMIREWKDYVCKQSSVSVACTLTFRTSRKYYCALTETEKWETLDEGLAEANLLQFSNRLNSTVYKNAYKRYGKKLDMVCTIEGGKRDLRNNSSDTRLHSHLAIELPQKYSFQQFKDLVYKTWVNTLWGNKINRIELIKNKEAYADYQVKDGMDSIVLGATNIKDLDINKDIINR